MFYMGEGLHKKFTVIRNSNGEEVKEFTFTFIPEHDEKASLCLVVYATMIMNDNPELAGELLDTVSEIAKRRLENGQ